MSKAVQSSKRSKSSTLDDLLSRGVAEDVYHARLALDMWAEIASHAKSSTKTGIGRKFLGELQSILDRDLFLSLNRLYEPNNPQYKTRSIPAVIEFLHENACSLIIHDRHKLLAHLSSHGIQTEAMGGEPNELLTKSLAARLRADVPRFDRNSGRPLDAALANLKGLRDKGGIAHRDHTSPESLIVPGWPRLVELIEIANQFVGLIGPVYLCVHFDIRRDARQVVHSLARLLNCAGLNRVESGLPVIACSETANTCEDVDARNKAST